MEQLRGIEGSRVRQTYALLAKQYGVKWNGRKYDPKELGKKKGDVVNPLHQSLLHHVCTVYLKRQY